MLSTIYFVSCFAAGGITVVAVVVGGIASSISERRHR